MFLLYSKVNPVEEVEAFDPNRIEITDDTLAVLRDEWVARWNRPPTDQEFKGLVDAYVKEEILFREATKLGLEKGDTIIRRRLAQKMEFLTSDIADLEEITDEKLTAYYQEHADDYRVEAEVGFRHLFFSSEQRENAQADATALLALLKNGSLSFDQAVEQSDRTLLSPEFSPTAVSIIGRQFGESFANEISEGEAGSWMGPVKSGYGLHLVRIDERIDSGLPELDSIRDRVLGDYRYHQRNKLNEQMLAELLETYEVVIGSETEAEEAP